MMMMMKDYLLTTTTFKTENTFICQKFMALHFIQYISKLFLPEPFCSRKAVLKKLLRCFTASERGYRTGGSFITLRGVYRRQNHLPSITISDLSAPLALIKTEMWNGFFQITASLYRYLDISKYSPTLTYLNKPYTQNPGKPGSTNYITCSSWV